MNHARATCDMPYVQGANVPHVLIGNLSTIVCYAYPSVNPRILCMLKFVSQKNRKEHYLSEKSYVQALINNSHFSLTRVRIKSGHGKLDFTLSSSDNCMN